VSNETNNDELVEFLWHLMRTYTPNGDLAQDLILFASSQGCAADLDEKMETWQ